MFFWGCFWENVFPNLFSFWDSLGVPREIIFGCFLRESAAFLEKVGPSLLHTFTAFWLDFARKREKASSKLSSLFWCGNKGTQTVFYHFKHVFGVILGSLLVDFWSLLVDCWKFFATFRGKYLGDRSGTALGFILAWFRTEFMNMTGVIQIGGTGRKAFTIYIEDLIICLVV